MPTRFILLAAVMLFVICPTLRCEDHAAPRPVSVQEISLLLRSGYTGDEVLKETAGRPLLAPIDAAAERSLLDAGADARTVAALRDSHRLASATEADGLRQQQAAADQYKLAAWEAEQARRMEAARQTTQTKLAARRDEEFKATANRLHDKLVIFKDDRLGPYDNTALAGKRIFLLYATSAADKAARQLTPPLVDFYKQFVPAHPECEFVLLSGDRSAADMEKFMRQQAMPWPALAWDRLAQEPALAALTKGGTPRCVLIDGAGTIIADNFENGKLVSPEHVLEALKAKVSPAAPATAAR